VVRDARCEMPMRRMWGPDMTDAYYSARRGTLDADRERRAVIDLYEVGS